MPRKSFRGVVVDSRGQKIREDELTIGFNPYDGKVYVQIGSITGATHRKREVWVDRLQLTDALSELFEGEIW